jgi:hypothetical protein
MWKKTKEMRNSRLIFPLQVMIYQKQLENVEYFDSLGSVITHDARRRREIKFSNTTANAVFNRNKTFFNSKFDLNLTKKLAKCYIWGTAFYNAETWTLRTVGQKYLKSFEAWCWRRMEKISRTNRVRNDEILHRVKEERNMLRTIKRRTASCLGYISCRNCLIK